MDASALVAALEATWSAIQLRHPDVPDVVVTLGAGSIGVPAGALKLGHFAAERWVSNENKDPVGQAELFVGGEGLRRGAEPVLATLLHEAAHGVAHARGIKDTSRQGRYHNTRFKLLGEELGLTITQAPTIGWSSTELAPGTADEYAEEIAALSSAIVAFRNTEGAVPVGPTGGGKDGPTGGGRGIGAKRPKNGLVLVCECSPGRRIRASAAVVERGSIVCGVCSADFVEASAA
ncbi:hypothetical protein [Nocardioides albus]|uniref:SprT-like family protein n=1 Tax=Nocardioides albus TaxID=1841 RepID=A0A7W5FA22_9ACTN|nr:hypothetical protein [Nocardioides albus]MBB3090775.1 hypothetical protein [Nocardioides albus]GGU37412.1 hypothetical protein GCM10007979_40500 [Nocardioides albus]